MPDPRTAEERLHHHKACPVVGCSYNPESWNDRRELFEAGRATGTVEGWADYTDFISKLERTLEDMAPLYHETAIAAESDYDDLHPGVAWDRCPDPLCARARALTGNEPGYPPREDPNA